MVYQIWQTGDDGAAALMEELSSDERAAFIALGARCIETIDVDDPRAAQDLFIAWCRQRCPDATEESADPVELRKELMRQFEA